jgi:hypothetical protein
MFGNAKRAFRGKAASDNIRPYDVRAAASSNTSYGGLAWMLNAYGYATLIGVIVGGCVLLFAAQF